MKGDKYGEMTRKDLKHLVGPAQCRAPHYREEQHACCYEEGPFQWKVSKQGLPSLSTAGVSRITL